MRLNTRFLIRQAAALLLVAYLVLIGGSESGVIFYAIRRVTLVILLLAVIAWIVSWARRKFPFPRTRLDLVWLVFVLTQLLATALSTDPRLGLTRLMVTLLCWLAFYISVDLLRHYKFEAVLVNSLLFIGVMLIMLGLAQLVNWYGSWWMIGGWEHPIPPATMRLQAIMSHPNMLAAHLNVLLPFGAAVWVKARGCVARVALATWLVLMLVLLLATSSRGAWIATAFAAAVMVLLMVLDRPDWVADRWRRLQGRPVYLGLLVVLVAGVLTAGGILVVLQGRHPQHGPLFSSRQALWRPVWAVLLQSPLLGTGLATYAGQAMRIHSIPPWPLYNHAHSFPLNTLLESGLLGALALGAFAVVVARSALLEWRGLPRGSRYWLIAAVAGLAATAIHSLFETPQVIAGFSLLIVLVLALIETRSPPPRRQRWIDRGSRAALGMVCLVLAGVAVGGQICYEAYVRGIGLANAGQYEAAAPVLDRAAARDSALASNWFQAGYVHALLGNRAGDAAHLKRAVEYYQKGLALQPSFSINLVNLGALLWSTGDEAGAREALEKALDRAPGEAVTILTLGAFEEDVGSPTRAAELFRRGLGSRPAWSGTYFFRATPLRAATREQWSADRPPPSKPPACWDALSGGELGEARRCFSAQRTFNNPNPPYYGLGLTELAAADLAQAEWYFRVAAWISGPDPRHAARIDRALGDVLARRGDLAGAVRSYERALGRLDRPGPMPNATGGLTTSYTWGVYSREAIADSFLPGVVWLTITDEDADCMLQLGTWYEQLGRTEEAARTYRDLLEVAPDVLEAAERLQPLESGDDAG